jgi:hypothetical protein
VGRIVNRRNAVFGWAAWNIFRQWAAHRRRATVHADQPRIRRWLRRFVRMAAAALAALGALAVWRKLRSGGEDEWVVPDSLDVEGVPAEAATPLTAVQPDDDIPPAA